MDHFSIGPDIDHHIIPTVEEIHAAVKLANSLVKSCVTLDHTVSEMDYAGYDQWVEAITETAFTIKSWGGTHQAFGSIGL